MLKIKIELNFTYDEKAIKLLEEEIKQYKEEEGEDITTKEFLETSVKNMIYDRFTCDYQCVDGETLKVSWTIEES